MASETELIQAAQAGDIGARNALIVGNLPFIHWQARRLGAKGWPLEHAELVTEGVFGLIRAIDLFDASHGCRLITLAAWHVRQRMTRAARRARGAATVAVHANTPEAREARRPAVSLDAPIGDDGDPLVTTLPDPRPSPEEATACRELAGIIATLDPRSASILRRRFAGERLEAIGTDLGVTRERVRQLEGAAVSRLRRRVA